MPPLPPALLEKDFLTILTEVGIDHTTLPSNYYCFIMRVAKVYHSYNKDNDHHFNRHEQCTDAITAVFNTIPTNKPHAGVLDEATRVVLPILERLFDMTEREANVGSQEWYLQAQMVPNVLTIEQLVTSDLPNHSLKKAWIKYQKSRTIDPRGYPPHNFAVSKVTQNYTKVSTYKISKRQSRKYGKIHFFRSASHQYVILALKRDNQYPIMCPAEHSPTGHVPCQSVLVS